MDTKLRELFLAIRDGETIVYDKKLFVKMGMGLHNLRTNVFLIYGLDF